MFRKALDRRYSDTYSFIQTQLAGATHLDECVALIDLRVSNLDKTGEMVGVVEAMSLGFRWEISKSATETRRRHYIRAVLLGLATLGDPDNQGTRLNAQQLKARKPALEKASETDLDKLLRRIVALNVSQAGGRSFVGFTRSLEKANATWALDRINEAVTRVERTLQGLSRNANEAQRFAYWFGTSDPAVVRKNFGQIFKGVQGGVMLIKDDSPDKDKVFGYVYRAGPNNPPRIYLCNAFWRAGQLTWNANHQLVKDGRNGFDNPLGVILHELSHLFAATRDHRYGKAKCHELATSEPALAIENADNHEYYAESVMTQAVFKP
jgi:hypothetical protein